MNAMFAVDIVLNFF